MHIPRTMRLNFGTASIAPPPMVTVIVTQSELHRLLRILETDAIEAENDGALDAAERIAGRAAALREAGRAIDRYPTHARTSRVSPLFPDRQ